MADSRPSKRVRIEDPWECSRERRHGDLPTKRRSNSTSCRKRQQTLTQIQFVSSLPSPASDSELEEQLIKPPKLDFSPMARPSTGRKRQSSKKQKTTITQMDFLSTPLQPDLDKEDMTPLPAKTKTSRKRQIPEAMTSDMLNPESDSAIKVRTKRSKKGSKEGGMRNSSVAEIHQESTALSSYTRGHERQNLPNSRSNEQSPRLRDFQNRGSASLEIQDSEELRDENDRREGSRFTMYADADEMTAKSVPRTPVAMRRRVIPSSQSPESSPPTASKSQSNPWSRSEDVSPLRERCQNIRSLQSGKNDSSLGLKKKHGYEPVKSKIVILPVAISSQGAVGRGSRLTRSQWPETNNIFENPVATGIIPSSQDDETTEELDFEGLPNLLAVSGSPQLCSAVQDEASRIGHDHKSHLHADQDDPPFSPGTPIRSSSIVDMQATSDHMEGNLQRGAHGGFVRGGHPQTPLSLTRSDSEAAAAQLHSDMLFHSTQIATTATGSSISSKASERIHPSQISTQGPTQPLPQLLSKSRTDFQATVPSPETQYIKIKSSSSFPVPLEDIPHHSQDSGCTSSSNSPINQATETNGHDSDDLNPHTYHETNTGYPAETLDASRYESGDPTFLTGRTAAGEETVSSPVLPRRAIQNSSSHPFDEINDSTSPSQCRKSLPHSSQPAPSSPPSTQSMSGREEQNQSPTKNYPFSSSPIIKGALWAIPDSLMESLPKPPPGWNERKAYDEEDMRNI